MSEGIGAPRDTTELRERLADALTTLKRIPAQGRSLGDLRSAWPDYVRSTNEAYGYHDASGGKQRASSSDIARMDEVLGWIARAWSVHGLRGSDLPADAGSVAWLRVAAGWPWPRIAARRRAAWGNERPAGGNTPPSLRLMVEATLTHMLVVVLGVARSPMATYAPAPTEPALVWDVGVDHRVEERVTRIRADGSALVQIRHARATWRTEPGKAPED